MSPDLMRNHGEVTYRFADIEIDTDLHEARERDRVVTENELLDEVWGSRYIGDSAVTSRLKSARQASATAAVHKT